VTNQWCPAFHGIAIKSEVTSENKKLLSRLRCKSWSCPFCASGNRARWQAFLLDVLPAISEVWSFHTITLPSWVRENDDFDDEQRTLASLSLIRANWDKLMKRVKRQLGANVQYFRVFEKHWDGVLHVHFLLSHWIPDDELKISHGSYNAKKDTWNNHYSYWRWLKDNAPECGFGFMTSSENLIEAKAATGYVTKYMTKEDYFVTDMLSKYRVRRFQSSQGLGSQENWGKSEDFWEIRSFIDGGMISQQDYHDLNIKRDIVPSMLGNQNEYPPTEQYQKAQEEQERRKSLKN